MNTTSQTNLILNLLKNGQALTCLDAFKMGLGMNLRSRISDIKKRGYNVSRELVLVGESKRVARYSLELNN